jgi:hypothetical protein
MNRALVLRSLRDSWLLLASCCALTVGFIWLRVWVASKIRGEAFIRLFSEALKSFSSLLPVPIEDLASPMGRAAFSYEELPVILLLGLWTSTLTCWVPAIAVSVSARGSRSFAGDRI